MALKDCYMSKRSYKKGNIESLILAVQSGDNKALEELIRRVQKSIFTMFSYLTDKRQDIADLTQETLLKMARNISHLKEPKLFKAWVNQIATNVFYDYLKKQTKEQNVEFNNDKILSVKDKIGCEPGEKCLFSEMEKLIKMAMLNLPENLRLVIVLREYEGLSYEDISKITNTTLGTVKSRISRARLRLQDELKEFI